MAYLQGTPFIIPLSMCDCPDDTGIVGSPAAVPYGEPLSRVSRNPTPTLFGEKYRRRTSPSIKKKITQVIKKVSVVIRLKPRTKQQLGPYCKEEESSDFSSTAALIPN